MYKKPKLQLIKSRYTYFQDTMMRVILALGLVLYASASTEGEEDSKYRVSFYTKIILYFILIRYLYLVGQTSSGGLLWRSGQIYSNRSLLLWPKVSYDRKPLQAVPIDRKPLQTIPYVRVPVKREQTSLYANTILHGSFWGWIRNLKFLWEHTRTLMNQHEHFWRHTSQSHKLS